MKSARIALMVAATMVVGCTFDNPLAIDEGTTGYVTTVTTANLSMPAAGSTVTVDGTVSSPGSSKWSS